MDSNLNTNRYQGIDDSGVYVEGITAGKPTMFWVGVLLFNAALFTAFVLAFFNVIKV